MPANATEWDARHREAAQRMPAEPASIVLEWLPLLPKGPTLDIACGIGRHTLLVAKRNQAVLALDWSDAALEILENRAREAKLRVHQTDVATISEPAKLRTPGVQLMQADLEIARLPTSSFSLILCIQYLQRSLFPQMARALQPGGLLVFETFTRAQLNYSGGPRNPAYLLEQGELRTAFPELRVLFYRELNAGQGIASLVAQKPE